MLGPPRVVSQLEQVMVDSLSFILCSLNLTFSSAIKLAFIVIGNFNLWRAMIFMKANQLK